MAPTTMATQRAGCAASVAPSSLPAHVVGNAFAKQYYSTLQSSPEIAYRFYLNDSCLARPSGDSVDGDGANCVTTVQAIQEKITATCAGLASVEVLTVDSHHSYCGGVTVLVTGRFTFAGGDGATASPRAFMQSFFLAPQGAKSYYVHNDTFRFIGGGGAATATASASTSPAMAAGPGKGGRRTASTVGIAVGTAKKELRMLPDQAGLVVYWESSEDCCSRQASLSLVSRLRSRRLFLSRMSSQLSLSRLMMNLRRMASW
ncbi:unnamed protein product [Urochloa humidicola]